MDASLHDQILAQIAADRIPRDDQGIAFEVLVAANHRGELIEDLRAYVATVKATEDRQTGQDSLDAEDGDGKPFLHDLIPSVGQETEEVEEWRVPQFDKATEEMLRLLREGTAAVAEALGVSQRQAQRYVRDMVERTRRHKGLWDEGEA